MKSFFENLSIIFVLFIYFFGFIVFILLIFTPAHADEIYTDALSNYHYSLLYDNNHSLYVPTADTLSTRQIGLRGSISPLLLFKFHQPVTPNFTMSGCNRPIYLYPIGLNGNVLSPILMLPGSRIYHISSPVIFLLESTHYLLWLTTGSILLISPSHHLLYVNRSTKLSPLFIPFKSLFDFGVSHDH